MRTIPFNKENLIDTVRTSEKPVLNIVRAVYNSNDNNWVQRLLSASLTLKTTCYDNEDKLIYYKEQILILGSYITPYHRQPVLEIDYTENFQSQLSNNLDRQSYWITTVELSNLLFIENETLNVSILERIHFQERVEDWKRRIDNLYKEINDWLAGQSNYSCKIAHSSIMFEDIMRTFEIPQQNIKSLDISYNGKIILAFKPKGLWTISGNGRIDIISSKGSFMLVDFAEQFQPPLWHIYTSDKKNKNPFNKTVFFEVLSFITK
jgi:hypothetical protein